MLMSLKLVKGQPSGQRKAARLMLLTLLLTGTWSLHAGQAASKWRDRIRRSFSAPRGKALPGPERVPSHGRSRGDLEQREPIMERIYPAGEPQQAVSALLQSLNTPKSVRLSLSRR